MNRPTSPRQHKKQQKATKGQGKSFPEIINSAKPIPSLTNNPMEQYSAIPPRLHAGAATNPHTSSPIPTGGAKHRNFNLPS